MATVTNIINVCDLCGSEEDVKTRTVRIDRRTAELEVCPSCWVPFKEIADKFIAAGRRVNVPSRTAKKSAPAAGGEKPRSTRPATRAAAKKTASKPGANKGASRKTGAKKTAQKAAAK